MGRVQRLNLNASSRVQKPDVSEAFLLADMDASRNKILIFGHLNYFVS